MDKRESMRLEKYNNYMYIIAVKNVSIWQKVSIRDKMVAFDHIWRNKIKKWDKV